jgi:hypothetical protein
MSDVYPLGALLPVILSEAKNLRGGGVRDKRRQVPFGRVDLCLSSPAWRQMHRRAAIEWIIPQTFLPSVHCYS